MGEASKIVNNLEEVIRELKEVEELPHSVDDTLVDRLIDSIQSRECGLVDLVKNMLNEGDLVEYGSVSLSILLRITAKIVSAGVMSISDSQSISTVLSSLSSLPSSSVQDAVMILAIEMRKSGMEEWNDLREWILSRLPSDEISVFVRRKTVEFLKMEKDGDVIKSIIILSINNLDTVPSAFVLESYCTLLAHFNGNLNEEEKEKIWKSAKKCHRLFQSFIDLLTVIGEGCFSSHLSTVLDWNSSAGRMKIMIAIARKFNDRSIISSILETEEASIDLLDSLLPSLSQEELFNLFSSIPPSSPFSSSSFTSLLSQLISRFPPSSIVPILPIYSIYSFYLPRVMKDPSPLVKTLPSITDWPTVLPHLHNDLLSRIESCVTSNEWETRDSALELLQIMPTVPSSLHATLVSLITSDPSPYIRSLSLRLVDRCDSLLLLECIEDVILKDDDHLVRSEGARIVVRKGVEGPWKEKMDRMAQSILMDEDRETRLEGLKMIEMMIGEEEDGKGWKWRQELLRWRMDTDIGLEVRRLLGEEEINGEKEEDVIDTLIASLCLHSEDIDCY
ncbi:hypothetical protein PENTCL1PPCAC_6748 [Pristionchus entomophagus]|uniref:Uncharacterized protein n=1 Tax=Pristionchus entomophagus TaxID=358040 RepID=A0AAV5SN83_9BILA|nr:hypothetical protein PENTCL1PPCAC_6748 [Pristionchus entomophagus]